MHRRGHGGRPYAVAAAPVVDMLDPALWEIVGYRSDRTTFSRPGGTTGPLIISVIPATGDSAFTGLFLKSTTHTNVLVQAETLPTGWDFTTYGDTNFAGPAIRMNGTNLVSNWTGYNVATRNALATSRRVKSNRFTAGTANTVVETSSLPATWIDGVTRQVHEIEMTGNLISSRAKLLGAGSWAHDSVGLTDTNFAGPGRTGFFWQIMRSTMTLEIHAFAVTPL